MRLPVQGKAASSGEALEGQVVDAFERLARIGGRRDDPSGKDEGGIVLQRCAGKVDQAVLADAARADDGDEAARSCDPLALPVDLAHHGLAAVAPHADQVGPLAGGNFATVRQAGRQRRIAGDEADRARQPSDAAHLLERQRAEEKARRHIVGREDVEEAVLGQFACCDVAGMEPPRTTFVHPSLWRAQPGAKRRPTPASSETRRCSRLHRSTADVVQRRVVVARERHGMPTCDFNDLRPVDGGACDPTVCRRATIASISCCALPLFPP